MSQVIQSILANLAQHLPIQYTPSYQPQRVGAVTLDSRSCEEGDIFIAFKGKNLDAHTKVKDIIHQVSYVIVNQPPHSLGIAPIYYEKCIQVEDTLVFINHLATALRAQFQGQVIAVTGSVGKTTLKEWLTQVLQVYGDCFGSKKSFNNHLGVPISLMHLHYPYDFAVFELGMSHEGEIAYLANLVRPHVAVITRLGAAHIGNFESLESIYKEKLSLIDSTVNLTVGLAHQPYSEAMQHQSNHLVTIATDPSLSSQASVKLLSYEFQVENYRTAIECLIGTTVYRYHLKGLSLGNITNSLLVLGVVYGLGLAIYPALKVLESIDLALQRGRLYQLQLGFNKPITIIDDSFNANILSMQNSLEVLSCFAKQRRTIAVLGGMRELGDLTLAYHEQVAEWLSKSAIHTVVCCGEEAVIIYDYLKASKANLEIVYYPNYQPIANYLIQILQPNDVILFKGSRFYSLNKIIDELVYFSY